MTIFSTDRINNVNEFKNYYIAVDKKGIYAYSKSGHENLFERIVHKLFRSFNRNNIADKLTSAVTSNTANLSKEQLEKIKSAVVSILGNLNSKKKNKDKLQSLSKLLDDKINELSEPDSPLVNAERNDQIREAKDSNEKFIDEIDRSSISEVIKTDTNEFISKHNTELDYSRINEFIFSKIIDIYKLEPIELTLPKDKLLDFDATVKKAEADSNKCKIKNYLSDLFKGNLQELSSEGLQTLYANAATECIKAITDFSQFPTIEPATDYSKNTEIQAVVKEVHSKFLEAVEQKEKVKFSDIDKKDFAEKRFDGVLLTSMRTVAKIVELNRDSLITFAKELITFLDASGKIEDTNVAKLRNGAAAFMSENGVTSKEKEFTSTPVAKLTVTDDSKYFLSVVLQELDKQPNTGVKKLFKGNDLTISPKNKYVTQEITENLLNGKKIFKPEMQLILKNPKLEKKGKNDIKITSTMN